MAYESEWKDDAGIDGYPAPDRVREGYWSPFCVLAWIASRSDKFVGAVQVWEEIEHAQRGSNFSAAALVLLYLEIEAKFAVTAKNLELDLREALETQRLTGVTAVDVRTGSSVLIERERWPHWRVNCSNHGLELLAGYVDFRFPSDAVRRAFVANETTAQSPKASAEALRDNRDKWAKREPTKEQKRVMEFFTKFPQYLAGGANRLDPTALRRKYCEWLNRNYRGEVALTREPFERWLARHQMDWRPTGRGGSWEKVTDLA